MITRILAAATAVSVAVVASLWSVTVEPAEAQSPSAPFSARVFTTREGLIGQTTANGRVIRSDDLFAALPSRLGLSGRILGYAAATARVPVMCQIRGQKISGNVRSTDQWNRVAPGMYVSHAFVKTATGFTASSCTPAPSFKGLPGTPPGPAIDGRG